MDTNNLLYEIVYTSSSLIGIEEIEEMILQSTKRNKSLNITGCILYNEREFFQLLEGEKDFVHTLFEKIKQDQRHSNLRVMWESSIEKRAFENWSMIKQKVEKLPERLTGQNTTGKELIEILQEMLLRA